LLVSKPERTEPMATTVEQLLVETLDEQYAMDRTVSQRAS
jgi:hypothetical protein